MARVKLGLLAHVVDVDLSHCYTKGCEALKIR
jgi:hypothetical protein